MTLINLPLFVFSTRSPVRSLSPLLLVPPLIPSSTFASLSSLFTIHNSPFLPSNRTSSCSSSPSRESDVPQNHPSSAPQSQTHTHASRRHDFLASRELRLLKAETDAHAIRHALIRQLYSPVRWTESVEAMAAQGVTQLIEMGPGKVLTGLTKRIVDGLSAAAVNDTASLTAALAQE